MNWTEKHIKGLLHNNTIKGYSADVKKENTPALPQNHKSKALTWLEWNLSYWCNEHSLTLEKEYRFCDRGWRFDFAIATGSLKIAVEFEGGIFRQYSNQSGAHSTAKLFTKDTDKYNRASVLGWRVIRVTAMNYTTVLTTLNEMIK